MRSIHLSLLIILPLAILSGVVGCHAKDEPKVSIQTDLSINGKPWDATPRSSAAVLISGHSLTDPLPDPLVAIAHTLGTTIEWNRQSVPGSSVRMRTRGLDESQGAWAGYRTGFNRDSENMDVLAELRLPRTIQAGKYDVLLITEQHGLLGTLVWNDTVRYLRHFHDRFIEANPLGNTYFYEPWISISDKSDPRQWIAYERAASPIWQCIATRVNVALAHEGRADRIVTIPAALALAELVERATTGGGVVGVSRGSVRETMDALFSDDVHVSSLGGYFVALVTYSSIYRRSPVGAGAPESVKPSAARALQELAWDFVLRHHAGYQPLSLEACRDRVVRQFNSAYWAYERDIGFARDEGALMAFAKVMRLRFQWKQLFGTLDSSNPFYFDAASNHRYWLPAPVGSSQ